MRLEQTLFGAPFQNPIMLAAGTCGFGEEVAEVLDLGALGGLVTKSVTLEPRQGNPAPRVAEFTAGMVNSIGLANPGARAVRDQKLPWIRDNLRSTQVFVSVAGHSPSEFGAVVSLLDDADGFLGYELNLSCPNDTRRGGLPFALDPDAIRDVVSDVRGRTERPLLVKLAPNAPDLAPLVTAAETSGADGLTLVNTIPGLVLDPRSRTAVLGAGPGGVSGPAVRAVGVHAVWKARSLTPLPLVGLGGVGAGEDAVQYLLAGASLVGIGTASFWDPRAAGRVVKELTRFGDSEGVQHVSEWIGTARVGPGFAPVQIQRQGKAHG
jgi:dihydroorotate dehydrogenase (NAD+) catalytic subunit